MVFPTKCGPPDVVTSSTTAGAACSVISPPAIVAICGRPVIIEGGAGEPSLESASGVMIPPAGGKGRENQHSNMAMALVGVLLQLSNGRQLLPAAEIMDPAAPTLWLGDEGALRLLLAAARNAGGGWRKQGTPRCRLRRKACSTSFGSEAGSIRQNDPLPGSSWERGTLTK